MIKNLRASLAQAGHIKIGGKGEARQSRGGGTYRVPQKHDHFTITTLQREGNDKNGDLITDEKIMSQLAAEYADQDGKIRTLPIVVHSDDIDLVFPTAYVSYRGRSIYCRGDGETAERRVYDDRGEWQGEVKTVDCPCDLLQPDAKGNRRCKYSGALHCSLRVPGQAVAGAVHRWRTTSQISCEQMYGSLLQIIETVGILKGLPLVLRVRPVQVDPVGGRPSTVYVCHVELRAENLQAVQRQALELAQMRGALNNQIAAAQAGSYRAMLQEPGTGSAEDLEAEGEEYYPDAIDTAAEPVATEQPSYADAPLAGIMPPAETTAPAPAPVVPMSKVVDHAPVPPAAPATPESEPEPPKKRTRRTTCKSCGEMFGPGIVKNGACTDCRAKASAPDAEPEPEPPAKPADHAPEIGSGPPATPYQRMQAMVRDTIQKRGVDQGRVVAAIAQAWPDYEARTQAQTWTDDDIDTMEGVLGGLE